MQLPSRSEIVRIPEHVLDAELSQALSAIGLTLTDLAPRLGRPPKRARGDLTC